MTQRATPGGHVTSTIARQRTEIRLLASIPAVDVSSQFFYNSGRVVSFLYDYIKRNQLQSWGHMVFWSIKVNSSFSNHPSFWANIHGSFGSSL